MGQNLKQRYSRLKENLKKAVEQDIMPFINNTLDLGVISLIDLLRAENAIVELSMALEFISTKKERIRETNEARERRGKKPTGYKVCVVCGRLFVPERANTVCCSGECKRKRQLQFNRAWYQKQKEKK